MHIEESIADIIKHLDGTLNRAETVETGLQVIQELSIAVAKWADNHSKLLAPFDAKANPREIAEKISKGEIPPRFIGEKNDMVLKQEIFSLLNTKPLFRSANFEDELFARIHQLKQVAPNDWDNILNKISEQLHDAKSAYEAWITRNGTKLVNSQTSKPATETPTSNQEI